ncbi:hypothetical protein O3G_MSEX013830 [Manduca sexta]|uniref:Uncharacterized protein n=1 Tax=Manduca sexta TaxID=7130 RepID=A0A921ZS54_MANSE|nr:hypothetical protein O3G_MSEX013830 [Manduca sexta]
MDIKKEPDDILDVHVKKETDDDVFYNDNAIDYAPYFTAKTEKMDVEEDSVFQQNMADLQDYGDLFNVKEMKHDLDLDVKQQENLEQYLIDNQPLDAEVYELAPMFEDELVLDVKRERASTSFTASSSGVSDMDVLSPDVKMEPDEGHHTGDELTQEDVDLIEVLWKQDVDMGFSLEDPIQPEGPQATKVLSDEIDNELKKAQENLLKKKDEKAEREKVEIEKVKVSLLDSEIKEDDPWAGLSYTVDTETGKWCTTHLKEGAGGVDCKIFVNFFINRNFILGII